MATARKFMRLVRDGMICKRCEQWIPWNSRINGQCKHCHKAGGE